ncbi:MAG: dTDP-4-dehydrorhamnose reductase [Candidatus Promineifilaceae bacterium]|jgi:dTDP-4-dehydrorhamnose reductase
MFTDYFKNDEMCANRMTSTPNVPVFGATSIVGYNLCRLFPQICLPFIPANSTPRADMPSTFLNLEESSWIKNTLDKRSPKLVIYAHAVCHVGNCERTPEWATNINVNHVSRLLGAISDDVRLVYLSSDHVFGDDGQYTEASSPCPITVYGRTRVEAESLVLGRKNSLVIRSGLAIGPSFDGRSGHLDWLRYRSARGLPLTLVSDEARSAVSVEALSQRIMELSMSDVCGLRHIGAKNIVDRPALAERLCQQLQIKADLQRTTRARQTAPHLGRIQLRSEHTDALAEPLPSIFDDLDHVLPLH